MELRLPYVQLMIHSSELMPGGSPYNPDEKSIEYLYSQLEALFTYLKAKQVEGQTLLEFATSSLRS